MHYQYECGGFWLPLSHYRKEWMPKIQYEPRCCFWVKGQQLLNCHLFRWSADAIMKRIIH